MKKTGKIKKYEHKTSAHNKFLGLPAGWNAFVSLGLIVLAIVVVVPLLLVIIISFSSEKSLAIRGYSFWPQEWSIEAYTYLTKVGHQLVTSYKITIVYTLFGTLTSLFVMSLFAYVLAQRHFRPRKFMTFFAFFTMLFSGGLVPSYMVNVNLLGLKDSFWIFILPSLANAYSIIILRTFMQTTIPSSLFDAARIDGANDLRIYFQITLPLSKAGLATIGLFSVVGRWNDWFTGTLYIRDNKLLPLQTLLNRIQADIDFIRRSAITAQGGVNAQMRAALKTMPSESMRMAIAIVAVVPILFAYPFFQRYFITGLTIGSVKG